MTLAVFRMFTVRENDIVDSAWHSLHSNVFYGASNPSSTAEAFQASRATLLSKRLNTHHYTHEKGQHSLVESVALKALVELLYGCYVCYTISQRSTAPRIAIPSRRSTVDAAVQLSSALLKLSLHPDVHLFKYAI